MIFKYESITSCWAARVQESVSESFFFDSRKRTARVPTPRVAYHFTYAENLLGFAQWVEGWRLSEYECRYLMCVDLSHLLTFNVGTVFLVVDVDGFGNRLELKVEPSTPSTVKLV